MKKFYYLSAILLTTCILALSFTNKVEANDETVIKIGTYNIYSMGVKNSGMTQQRENNIKNVIKSKQLDVVALQEVDCNNTNTRNIGKNILGNLSSGDYLYQAYGQGLSVYGGQYGNGVESNLPIKGEQLYSLPQTGTNEARTLQKVIVEKNGTYLSVYNVHLDIGTDRVAQIKYVLDIVNRDPNPNKVILGDFNVPSASISMLDPFKNSGYTISDNWKNGYTVDYIITSPSVKTTGMALSGGAESSDHSMLSTDLIITGKGDATIKTEKNGNLVFYLDNNQNVLGAQEFDAAGKRTFVYEYYPNTKYGSHGTRIKNRFFIGYYGLVERAEERIENTSTPQKYYEYYSNAKYGIHGTKIQFVFYLNSDQTINHTDKILENNLPTNPVTIRYFYYPGTKYGNHGNKIDHSKTIYF